MIRIGTRGSKLALWQADFTCRQLEKAGVASELVVIKTKGDKIQHLGFDKIEGKGFFTKEIEDALLRGNIDMAVHSMKDLPTTPPDGLIITAVSYREDPADWLITRPEAFQAGQRLQLKPEPVVGTSSARRKAQFLDLRKDARIRDIRGNVPTRLEKLRRGEFDAILLAAAGLKRLGIDLAEFKLFKFNPKEFIPAPAQGVLAFQTLESDMATRLLLREIHHPEVSTIANVERKVLQLLGGGCHMPLGVYCERDGQGNFHIWAAKAERWDAPLKKARLSSSTSYRLAERVVEELGI